MMASTMTWMEQQIVPMPIVVVSPFCPAPLVPSLSTGSLLVVAGLLGLSGYWMVGLGLRKKCIV